MTEVTHEITSKSLLNIVRDLDYGFTINGMQTQEYNVNNAKEVVNNLSAKE